jgi:hypothetical protein
MKKKKIIKIYQRIQHISNNWTVIWSMRRWIWTQSYTRYSWRHNQRSSIRSEKRPWHLVMHICFPFNMTLHTIWHPLYPIIKIMPNPSNFRKTVCTELHKQQLVNSNQHYKSKLTFNRINLKVNMFLTVQVQPMW